MVVAVGLTLFVPVAALEVKLPGVMAMLVAPVTAQLKVLLPDEMLVGSAEKEAIAGAEPFGAGGVVEPQPVSPTKINPISRICDHRNSAEEWSPQSLVRGLSFAAVWVLPFVAVVWFPRSVEVMPVDGALLYALISGKGRTFPAPS